MSKYAKDTDVSSHSSRAEIEKTLVRYGATGFAYGWQGTNAQVLFQIQNRNVQFILPMPDKTKKEFTHTPGRGIHRTPEAVEAVYEQAIRQRWRALALVIKAKLECVDSGITTVEKEFLAYIVLPNGETVGGWVMPRLEQAYASGKMLPLLPGAPQ